MRERRKGKRPMQARCRAPGSALRHEHPSFRSRLLGLRQIPDQTTPLAANPWPERRADAHGAVACHVRSLLYRSGRTKSSPAQKPQLGRSAMRCFVSQTSGSWYLCAGGARETCRRFRLTSDPRADLRRARYASAVRSAFTSKDRAFMIPARSKAPCRATLAHRLPQNLKRTSPCMV